jgi:ABC-type transport system involved in cytochrome bd biosynthesis fused ATPase/permease subunit
LVGEAGWQLSHGERSRVCMARALLHGADLVVLDESFAELDPDNLQKCLPEAAELSKSMLVVAHARKMQESGVRNQDSVLGQPRGFRLEASGLRVQA